MTDTEFRAALATLDDLDLRAIEIAARLDQMENYRG
jgi:hypothetical protein